MEVSWGSLEVLVSSGTASPMVECKLFYLLISICNLVAQMRKNLPAVQETWVQTLGWEDPLEKKMATHCSFLAWEIPLPDEPGGLYSPVQFSSVAQSCLTLWTP